MKVRIRSPEWSGFPVLKEIASDQGIYGCGPEKSWPVLIAVPARSARSGFPRNRPEQDRPDRTPEETDETR